MQFYRAFILFCFLNVAFESTAQKKEPENPPSIKKGKSFLIKVKEGIAINNSIETPAYLNQLLGLSKKDELRLTSEKSDKLGFNKQKFQQYHKGIKVEYGIVSVQAKNKQLDNVGGEIYEIPETLNTIATINENSALKLALQYTGAKKYKWENEVEETHLRKTGSAGYYPIGELVFVKVYMPSASKRIDDMALAYKFDIYAEVPLSRKYVYVDAHTGAIVHTNSIIKHADGIAATRFSGPRVISTSQNGSGANYWLRDITRGSGVETYNMNNGFNYSAATDFLDADNNWTATEFNNAQKDNAALDAHWGSMKTFDFFKEKFDRNSYDDNGTKMKSYVHYGVNYVNAFWNGAVMTYGDGNGVVDPLTSIDICAHEIGHAICSSTADLVYENEPGALNESLSDIWGATVEYYAAPEKSPWLLGEDVNFIIRSMSNPNQYNQPDTYKGNFWDPNQRVHANSGVMNHWYYILVQGKDGVDDNGLSYSVQGIGFEKAARIVYRMETTYLSPNSQYTDARTATIQSAIDLFGSSSNEVLQTYKAWNAVGVYDTTSSPTNLTAIATTSTSVSLTWVDRTTNENGFVLERSPSFNSGFTVVAVLGANTTSYSDHGLATSSIYYYRVKATFTDYTSSYSNLASVALGVQPITMSNTTISACNGVFLDPGGLGEYANNLSVTMRINPSEVGKKVKVSFSSFSLNSFDYLFVYDGDVLSSNLIGAYTGSTLPPDMNALNPSGALSFVFNSNGENTGIGWQANVTCELLPMPPTNLTATTFSTTQINLTWTDNSTNETAIVIERKSATSQFRNVATLSPNATSYSDQALATDNTYSYRIRVLVGTTYSSYSNIASASVGNPPLIMQAGTFQLCSSIFLDPGGHGNYGNNQSYVMRVNPSEAGKKIKVSFTSFNLETDYDYLIIYDGDNTPANLIGRFTGSTIPPEITATNSTGGLTFEFFSDFIVVGTGWSANLACVIVPSPPSNLIATVASSTQINLVWQDNSFDETAMILERKGSSPNAPFSTIATLAANTSSYSDQGLLTDERYYYRVRAFNGTAHSAYSNIADALLGTMPLVMQSGTFQACASTFLDPGGSGDYGTYQYVSMRINPAQAGKKVKVSFSSFSLNSNDYLAIYDGDTFTENLIGIYRGTTLPPDINASKSTGGLTFIFSSEYLTNSGWRATLSCETPPNPPSGLTATVASATQINLTWMDNSSDETGFAIDRRPWSAPSAPFVRVATVASNVAFYADQSLMTDERYYYRVRALKGTTYSLYSNTIDAVLGTLPVVMQNGTYTLCNSVFLDPGGRGDYSVFQYLSTKINPTQVGKKLKISFSSFSLSPGDFLSIYDGEAFSQNLIGTFRGTTLPPDINAWNPTGSLSFIFSSSRQTNSGWHATLSCETIPVGPTDLTATIASASRISLAWTDNSLDETGFAVERRRESYPITGFTRVATLGANVITYSDDNLANNERYHYRVRALIGSTYSNPSNAASATLGATPIILQAATVQACAATFLDPGGLDNYSGYHSIQMRINPAQTGKKLKVSFSSFNLNTSDVLMVYDGDPLNENLIGSYSGSTLPPEINALNVTGGLTFYFSSSGLPSAGWQAILSCVDLPNAPSNLAGVAISTTQINLNWQDNSTNETGVVIERRSSQPNTRFASIASLPPNSTSYSDQGLVTNQRYYYRVKVLNGTVYSTYSNIADIPVGNAPVLMTNGIVSTCGSQFFDSGHTGSYSNGENYVLTVNPGTAGGKVSVTFSSFNLESCCDWLRIYDGSSTASPLIGTYTSIPPVITATNLQGSLTFQFYSDGSATYDGWVASISCLLPPPVITFDNINKVFAPGTFDLAATAYPGANFVYNVVNNPPNTGGISLSGAGNKTVTLIKSGIVKLRAFLPAANGYPNAEKEAILTISKGSPFITFNDTNIPLGTPTNLSALASYVNASFSYSILPDPSNTAELTLSGLGNRTVNATKIGIVKIKASLAETDNYFAAYKVANITITPVVGFESVINDEIKIWPNPVSRFLTIATDSKTLREIRFMDALGRELFTEAPSSSEIQLDLEKFSSGTYSIKLSTDNGEIFRRILIVR
jgi:Zn-dependent metalloprotease